MARPETRLPPLPSPQSQDLLYMLLTMMSIVDQKIRKRDDADLWVELRTLPTRFREVLQQGKPAFV